VIYLYLIIQRTLGNNIIIAKELCSDTTSSEFLQDMIKPNAFEISINTSSPDTVDEQTN
jgi:hypothetical protein